MAKSLFLHVGLPKTGTTTLQRYFKKNKSLMAEQGIHYYLDDAHCKFWFANHVLALSVRNVEHPRIKYSGSRDEVWDRFEEYSTSVSGPLLISSEVFSEGVDIEYVRERLSGFSVKVMIYLRPQDLFVESLYRQTIWGGAEHSFDLFLSKMLSQESLIYSNKLKLWADLFGSDSLEVGVLGKNLYKNDLCADACMRLGIQDERFFGIEPHNEAIPKFIVDMLAGINGVVSSDKEKILLRNSVLSTLREKGAGLKMDGSYLTEEARKQIMDAVRYDNLRLQKEYKVFGLPVE